MLRQAQHEDLFQRQEDLLQRQKGLILSLSKDEARADSAEAQSV